MFSAQDCSNGIEITTLRLAAISGVTLVGLMAFAYFYSNEDEIRERQGWYGFWVWPIIAFFTGTGLNEKIRKLRPAYIVALIVFVLSVSFLYIGGFCAVST